VKSRRVGERKRLKARIPKLLRQESWRYKRIKESWRRPRGVTNRTRRGRRGWPKRVSVGYKTPSKWRHLHPSGLREVNVDRVADLEGLDAKECVARISHTVGERKRVAIINRAKELQIRIVNPGAEGKGEAPEVEEPIIEKREPVGEQVQSDATLEQPKEETKP